MTQEELAALYNEGQIEQITQDAQSTDQVKPELTQEQLAEMFKAGLIEQTAQEDKPKDMTLADAITNAGSSTLDALKYNASKLGALTNAGLANLNQLVGVDDSLFRENQAFWQEKAKEADAGLTQTMGDGLSKDILKIGADPLMLTPIGVGGKGLATLGGIMAGTTAGDIAVTGDMTGANVEDLGQVATSAGLGIAGGKILEKGTEAIGNLIKPNYAAMEMDKLLKEASSGNKDARIMLAEKVKANSETIKAAENLGVDLPVDALATGTTGTQIKELAGLARSQVGGEASAQFKASIDDITTKGTQALEELGAKDISMVSNETLQKLTKTREDLSLVSTKLYDDVLTKIPKNDKMEMPNIQKVIDEIKAEVNGDLTKLSKEEKELFTLIKGANYNVLDRARRGIGEALYKNKGPFANADSRTLNKLYRTIQEDQMLNAERLVPGSADILRTANAMTVQRKSIEESMVKGFGVDSAGSIVNDLKSAVTSGISGDTTKLNATMKAVPSEFRSDAIISAISEVSKTGDNFSFNKFGKYYGGLVGKSETRKILKDNIGEEGIKKLDDLYKVSRAMEDATNKIISTGKANQAILDNIKNGGFFQKMIEATLNTTIRKTGLPINVDMVLTSPTSRIESINKLMNSQEFKAIITDIAKNGKSSERAKRLLGRNKDIQKAAKNKNMTTNAYITYLFEEETIRD